MMSTMMLLPVPKEMKYFFIMDTDTQDINSKTGVYQVWTKTDFNLELSSWRKKLVPFPSFIPGRNYICVLDPPVNASPDGLFLLDAKQSWLKLTIAVFEV